MHFFTFSEKFELIFHWLSMKTYINNNLKIRNRFSATVKPEPFKTGSNEPEKPRTVFSQNRPSLPPRVYSCLPSELPQKRVHLLKLAEHGKCLQFTYLWKRVNPVTSLGMCQRCTVKNGFSNLRIMFSLLRTSLIHNVLKFEIMHVLIFENG